MRTKKCATFTLNYETLELLNKLVEITANNKSVNIENAIKEYYQRLTKKTFKKPPIGSFLNEVT